jgi:hypothetical protein
VRGERGNYANATAGTWVAICHLYNVGCAGLMGVPAAGKDKCILVTFGTRQSDGAATYRVRYHVICIFVYVLHVLHVLNVCVCITCIAHVQ